MAIHEKSDDPKIPAIIGEITVDGGGFGVQGISPQGHGVHGESKTSRGVVGTSENFHGVFGKSINNVGVAGESDSMIGVLGVCTVGSGVGVQGENRGEGGFGVQGISKSGHGVHGESTTSRGVVGISQTFLGVHGTSTSGVGVAGDSDSGKGVNGQSKTGDGVFGTGRRGVVGESDTFQGVFGHSRANAGVVGVSEEFDGVFGESKKATAAGVSGHNAAGGLAGFFEGDVVVTGDIRLANADCAEDFDVLGADKVEPGTVMVLGNEGALSESQQAYDKRSDYKPGIVLDKQRTSGNRQPIALIGKVFCKVDAQFGAITVGDLLTTSSTPGHAMKTTDPFKAFGAVIGKALRPLTEGQGLIPILIALQ
jgi:hypothetical protein